MKHIMTAPSLQSSPWRGDDEVILAAADIFNTQGIQSLDVDVVAVSVGLEPHVVRARYPSSLDLVVGVLQHQHQQWTLGLNHAAAGTTDPREQILTLFSYLESCFMDDAWRGCSFINGYGDVGRTEPVIAALADEHLVAIETHLREWCAAAELPLFVADGLSLLVEGAKVEAAIHGTTQPARSARMAAAMLISVYDRTETDLFI